MRSLCISLKAFAVALCLFGFVPFSEAFGDESMPSVASSRSDSISGAPSGKVESNSAADKVQPVAVDAEKVRKRYSKITAFTAEVDQEKTAPFLARPLKSQATLSMNHGRIVWRTLKPVASVLSIDAEGIHLESGASSGGTGKGAGEALQKVGKDPRGAAFIGFLRSLFALDFAGIEREFSLTFDGGVMKARPLPSGNLGSMIHAIDIYFAEDLSIQKVRVETQNETSTMVFKNFMPVEKAD